MDVLEKIIEDMRVSTLVGADHAIQIPFEEDVDERHALSRTSPHEVHCLWLSHLRLPMHQRCLRPIILPISPQNPRCADPVVEARKIKENAEGNAQSMSCDEDLVFRSSVPIHKPFFPGHDDISISSATTFFRGKCAESDA